MGLHSLQIFRAKRVSLLLDDPSPSKQAPVMIESNKQTIESFLPIIICRCRDKTGTRTTWWKPILFWIIFSMFLFGFWIGRSVLTSWCFLPRLAVRTFRLRNSPRSKDITAAEMDLISESLLVGHFFKPRWSPPALRFMHIHSLGINRQILIQLDLYTTSTENPA